MATHRAGSKGTDKQVKVRVTVRVRPFLSDELQKSESENQSLPEPCVGGVTDKELHFYNYRSEANQLVFG